MSVVSGKEDLHDLEMSVVSGKEYLGCSLFEKKYRYSLSYRYTCTKECICTYVYILVYTYIYIPLCIYNRHKISKYYDYEQVSMWSFAKA